MNYLSFRASQIPTFISRLRSQDLDDLFSGNATEMSFCIGGVRVARRTSRQIELPVAVLPVFLCPGIVNSGPAPRSTRCSLSRRHLYTTEASRGGIELKTISDTIISRSLASTLKPTLLTKLPLQCSGCGAFSQTAEPEQPGFYTLTRKSIKEHLEGHTSMKRAKEGGIFKNALNSLEESQEATKEQKEVIREFGSSGARGLDGIHLPSTSTNSFLEQNMLTAPIEPPLCDRCHRLKHHETGVSIHHPSVQSLQDTILESPYKYNHIYHIIDAADFPMSLVQGLHKLLHVTPQRSLNRRSQSGKFYHGRSTVVSFIVTRSDLFGPTKEHVDKLMPYLRSVLRDALGRAAQDARLGNLRCVSAKRQWWTKELKEEIWSRGGGGWMVGKVNVGKSQLFQDVFPKGRMGDWGKHTTFRTTMRLRNDSSTTLPTSHEITELAQKHSEPAPMQDVSHSSESVESVAQKSEIETLGQEPMAREKTESESSPSETRPAELQHLERQDTLAVNQSGKMDPSIEPLDTTSLLPPLPTETDYPAMPLVSSLPGTTASPIRVPFGNGKGELIDLPGLSRGDLELYVKPEYRSSVLMRSRVTNACQRVLKLGQSMLIGGFIRITPTTPDLHILVHNFTPLGAHQTSTEKAIGIQSRTVETNVLNIAAEGTESRVKSAGKFHLKWDITKARAGPITRKDAAGIKVENLPFRVLGVDILIEGVGWVELAAQIRKPYGYLRNKDTRGCVPEEEQEVDPSWPEIEVFSPEGRFVGQRRPMNASLMAEDKPQNKNRKARPRKAMKGAKKTEKKRAREATIPV